jgi:hypothetical protein
MRKARAVHPDRSERIGQAGQASVLLLLILGMFLLATIGFAIDLSNMWFHRQAAQSAADAACTAGAMDMLYLNNGTILTSPEFTPGTAGDCSVSNQAALCLYAGFNGYTATAAAASWGSSTPANSVAVSWSFPSSVTGVSNSGITNPFLNVVVQEKPAAWFMQLVGVKSMTVGATCTCGLTSPSGTPPIVILNPTVSSALNMSGGTHIVIIGGPKISIAVDSSANGSPGAQSSSNAVYCSGGAGYPIDTSAAGPSGTGGQLAIVGGPTTNQYCGANTTLNDPSNKLWKSPASSVSDPYASVSVPTLPGAPQMLTSSPVGDTTGCIQSAISGANPCARKDPTYGYITGIWVGPGTDSCPGTASGHYIGTDSGSPYQSYSGSCLEFTPGYYPTGINVSNLAGYSNDVAIFQPGVYYLNGSLSVGSSSTVRNVWTGTQPSTQGVMFYFLTGGPVFSGGSGAASSSINSIPSSYLNCSCSTTNTGMPSTLQGNILAAQCSAGGTYVGTPSSDSYSATGVRGLLFFADHGDVYQNTVIGAGASLAFTGTFYFHNSSYSDQVTLSGAGNSNTYAIGNIVVDQLSLSGSGTIQMGLTGSSAQSSPQVSLFQ